MTRALLLVAMLAGCAFPAWAQSVVVEYYHLDAVGSVRAVTNQSGQVVRRHDYFPFGDGSDGTTRGQDTLRYTGKERDPESGLDYFGARYYASRVGRFTTADEPENDFDLTAPQSLNRYAYARNNPLRYVDPDGRAIETPWDVFNVGLGIASFASNIRAGNYGSAALDAAGLVYDSVATAVPVLPGGAGSAIKAARVGSKVAKATEALGTKVKYIGKMDDLKGVPRNQTLLDDLPNLGNARSNYRQNSSVLRKAVRDGYEIRDASRLRPNSSPDPTVFQQNRTVGQSFLGAERNIMDNKGFTMNSKGVYVPKPK